MQLVIAEKPSVARNIAKVLHATNVKDGYLEGKEYLVSWCIGHLIELASADQYRDDWKAWKYETLPMIPENWEYQIKESTKGQFRVLKELLHTADITEVICATDAGREGELIFRLVYNQAECKLPFKRLWISSMEEKAILEGFQQLKDGHEYDDLYYSAVARSEADWLVGINATRLFTVLYHHRLIVGRVQTPTLAMLVEREKSIENFQKEKYYLVHLLMDGLDAVSSRIKEKSAAVQMMEDMKDETAQILSVKKEKKKVQPPKLYDLITLQREANRLLGFTAQQTLDYTQSLYEKKLVTYPRTDARVLSTAVAKEIYKNISGLRNYQQAGAAAAEVLGMESWKNIAKTRYVNDKQITDHYAIIPTGQGLNALGSVSLTAQRVYETIVRRFLCIFYPPAVYQKVSLVTKLDGESFFSSFKVLKEEGYLKIATNSFARKKASDSEKGGNGEEEEVSCDTVLLEALQKLKKGDILPVNGLSIKEGETSPPKRYNSGSMILAMENAGQLIEDEELRAQIKGSGIGTSATRAEILKKLFNIKYLALNKKSQVITPTLLGEMIFDVVNCSIRQLLNPELTASWEKGLTYVSEGSITEQEYMDKLEHFVRVRTQQVEASNYQYNLRQFFDAAAVNYRKPERASRQGGKKSS